MQQSGALIDEPAQPETKSLVWSPFTAWPCTPAAERSHANTVPGETSEFKGKEASVEPF